MKPVNFLQINAVGDVTINDLVPLNRVEFQHDGVNFFEIETELTNRLITLEQESSNTLNHRVNKRYDFSLDDLLADTLEKFRTDPDIEKRIQMSAESIDIESKPETTEKHSIVSRARKHYVSREDELSLSNTKIDKKPTPPWVLLIEDDTIIAGFLVHLLSRQGFEVHLAEDGRKAARTLEEIPPPNLVILDIMLPFIDGFELIKRIRKKCEWDDVPILMLTSKTQEQDIIRALDEGANDYMIKPFGSRELIARVDQFVSH